MKAPKGSRALAWTIIVSTILLVGCAIIKEMEGLASTMFITGFPTGAGMYANKQWTEYKNNKISKVDANVSE